MNLPFYNKLLVAIINIISVWIGILISKSNIDKKTKNITIAIIPLMLIWVNGAFLARLVFVYSYIFSFLALKLAWAVTPLLFATLYFLVIQLFKYKDRLTSSLSVFISISAIILSLIVILTDLIVDKIQIINGELTIIYGKLMLLFLFVVFVYLVAPLYILIKKYSKNHSIDEKIKIKYLLIGISIFYLANLIFNIFLPVVKKIIHYYWLGDYSLVILLIFISLAIIKHRLFGIKVILSELFSGLAITILFIDLLLSKSISEYIWKGILFVGFAIFGELMTRAMIREEQQKEKLQKIHNQLEKSYQKLKRLDQAKSEFLSIATHQLRSPLTATINVISTLLEEDWGKLNSTQKKYLQEIYHRSKKMTQLINNLLNLSRIELGRMKFNFQKIDLVETTNEIIDELECKVEAKNKKIKFKYNQPKRQKLFVSADRFQIQQIIQNFITNAFHYTNYGEIEVKIYPKNNSVIFSVQDTGIGLSKNEKEIIFEKFRRGKRAQNQYTEGSGLGLYLATKIIKAHHGRIWVKSKGENQGSTFYFSLPLAKATKE